MARPREFETNKALEDAMNVFWTHGYEGASLADLLEGMGITRGSLYKAFTDKRTLFLLVMDEYEKHAVTPAVVALTSDAIPDGLDRIEAVFRTIPNAVKQGDTRGCLLCTAAAGAASEDDGIADLVQRLLHEMKGAFDTALRHAAGFATINAQTRNILSDMLVSQYVGLRTLSRSGTSPADLDNSVTALVALLRARGTLPA